MAGRGAAAGGCDGASSRRFTSPVTSPPSRPAACRRSDVLAARGGLPHTTYTWGDEPERPGQRLANYWHGEFPYLPDTGYGSTTNIT